MSLAAIQAALQQSLHRDWFFPLSGRTPAQLDQIVVAGLMLHWHLWKWRLNEFWWKAGHKQVDWKQASIQIIWMEFYINTMTMTHDLQNFNSILIAIQTLYIHVYSVSVYNGIYTPCQGTQTNDTAQWNGLLCNDQLKPKPWKLQRENFLIPSPPK